MRKRIWEGATTLTTLSEGHMEPNTIEASYNIYINGRNLNGVTK